MGTRLSGLIAVQAHQPPPVALVRAALRTGPRCLRQLLLLLEVGATRSALRSFDVMRLRLGGRTAALRQSQHLEFGHHALQRHAEPITDSDPVRGLHPLGVQVDLASGDGRGGQGAGFVKSGVPQPFVQAVGLSLFVRPHAYTIAFSLPCLAV